MKNFNRSCLPMKKQRKKNSFPDHAQSRLCRCTFSTHDAASFVAARENLPYLLASFPLLKKEELYDLNQTRLTSPTPLQLDTTKRADIFLQWLSHIGPITNNGLHTFGMLNPSDLDHLLEILSASGRLLLTRPRWHGRRRVRTYHRLRIRCHSIATMSSGRQKSRYNQTDSLPAQALCRAPRAVVSWYFGR